MWWRHEEIYRIDISVRVCAGMYKSVCAACAITYRVNIYRCVCVSDLGWVIPGPWLCGAHQRAELSTSPPNLGSREAGTRRLQPVSLFRVGTSTMSVSHK